MGIYNLISCDAQGWEGSDVLYGLPPRGKDQHKTVVDFCAETLGEDFRNLTERFNRMRIKRHDFIYEPERPIPKSEVIKSLESAEKFVKKIIDKIKESNPQRKLF